MARWSHSYTYRSHMFRTGTHARKTHSYWHRSAYRYRYYYSNRECYLNMSRSCHRSRYRHTFCQCSQACSSQRTCHCYSVGWRDSRQSRTPERLRSTSHSHRFRPRDRSTRQRRCRCSSRWYFGHSRSTRAVYSHIACTHPCPWRRHSCTYQRPVCWDQRLARTTLSNCCYRRLQRHCVFRPSRTGCRWKRSRWFSGLDGATWRSPEFSLVRQILLSALLFSVGQILSGLIRRSAARLRKRSKTSQAFFFNSFRYLRDL